MKARLSSLVFSLSLTIFYCCKSLFFGQKRVIFAAISKLYTFASWGMLVSSPGIAAHTATSAGYGIASQHAMTVDARPTVKRSDTGKTMNARIQQTGKP